MERRDVEPEAERHRFSNRSQTPAGGETEGRSQREEGERAAVGDQGEAVSPYSSSEHCVIIDYIQSNIYSGFCNVRI